MKRGQIGQIITSVPAFIVVFIVMLVFVLVSAGIGPFKSNSVAEQSSLNIARADSRVLLEIFLSDQLSDSGMSVMGAAESLPHLSDSEGLALSKKIENLFDVKYSCGGKNKFFAVYLKPKSALDKTDNFYYTLISFVNYPEFKVSEGTYGAGKIVTDDKIETLFPEYKQIGDRFYIYSSDGLSLGVEGRFPC